MASNTENCPDWTDLLKKALEVPGTLSKAYRVFHNYSIGNQFLASMQLITRGLPISPIASFKRWKELGRNVIKGEKAIALYMPVPIKKKKESLGSDDLSKSNGMFFILKNSWFSLDQTEGDDYVPEVQPVNWDKSQALSSLQINMEHFDHINGNVQGYSHGRTIAVSPVAALPHKTLFHELAHIVLGHTTSDSALMPDGVKLPKCIREVEAEATAYLCCSTLDLPGIDESRGYIQHWLRDDEFPEKSARRIFSAADKILKAGVLKEVV